MFLQQMLSKFSLRSVYIRYSKWCPFIRMHAGSVSSTHQWWPDWSVITPQPDLVVMAMAAAGTPLH